MIAIGDYTISEIFDGESIQGDPGATISTSTEQYYLSDYNDQLSGGSWSDTEPSSIPNGKYLWGRWKFTMTDGATQYSDAVYRSTIQGIESKVNTLDNSITNKVWQTDINNSISSYDNSTGTAIRNRVTQTETNISGINTTISDMQTDIAGKADGSTVTEMQETLSEVEETAGNTATHFSNIVQTLGTNADGTSASGDVVHRMTDIESGYNGITQRVSTTETRLLGQYATSSTGASTQNKVATITPAVTGWELYTGATITVKFTNANTHATPNLNINGTGAKGIRTYSGGTLSEGEYKWKAGDVFTFTYNGTYWLMQDSMMRLRNNETTIQQTANNVLIKATENDTTAAQGGQHLIQSLINVAPDGVTIDADKVNIEGAAIFKSGRLSSESLNNTYDLKGAADAIEIGGRNILRDSGTMTSWWKASRVTISDGVATLTGSSSDWNANLSTSKFDASIYDGNESIISFDYKSTESCLIHRVYASTSADKDSTSWTRTKYIGADFTIPSSGGEWKRYVMSGAKISVASLKDGSGDVVSGFLQFYNRTNNVVFQMRHIKFEKGNKVTQWSPAPEDMVAQEQRIYYRTNNTINKPDTPSTWVSSINTVNNDWTTKRMEYDKDYKYLFTCIQRQAIGGAITHTDVLLDDTTTVIDGGNIITGSVTTNQLKTDAIKSLDYGAPTGDSQFSTKGTFFNLADQGEFRSKNFAIDKNGNAYFNGALTATSLTIAPGATFDGDIDQFKGASFNWNLLLETATPVTWTVALNTSNYMVKDCYKTISPVPKLFAVNDLVTIAFDWSTNATGGNFHVECGTVTPYGWGTVVSAEGGRSSTSNYVDISSSKQSGHFKVTFKIGTAQTGAADTLQWLRIRVDGADTSGKTFTISNAKAERGSTASDWCTAESEIHGKDGLDGISASGLAFLVNHWSIGSANNGECCFFGYNDKNEVADVDGWVMWNGQKLTITKGPWINPNKVAPYNTPILHVFRTKTSPYHADVWWDSNLLRWRGYMYTTSNSPGTVSNWTWDEATDCILAMYTEPDNEAAIVNSQLFTPPKKFSELPDPDNIHNIVDTSIDNIEIGGRNLLQGTANPQISSSYLPPYYKVLSGGDGVGSIESIEDSPVTGVTRAFRITGNTTGNRDFVQLVEDFNALWTDGQWMFSCYARGIDASATALIRVYTANLAFQTSISVGTSWTRIEVPISLNGSGAKTNEIKFQFGITGAGSIEYIAPMLERGTKASAWSYAPEDVDGNINKAKELANNALGNAATAQGTANNALKNAAIADGKAVSAQDTANEANGKADDALDKYGTMSGIVNDYNNLRNYYLDFNPTPSGISGLVIGARNSDGSDNAFKTEITNSELAFRQGTDKVAWINTNEFFINHGAIQTGLRVGNFVIFDEDGALNIKYEPRSTNE